MTIHVDDRASSSATAGDPGPSLETVCRWVTALWSKTVANGCTLEEAESANRRADAIVEKYGVTSEDLARVAEEMDSPTASSWNPTQGPAWGYATFDVEAFDRAMADLFAEESRAEAWRQECNARGKAKRQAKEEARRRAKDEEEARGQENRAARQAANGRREEMQTNNAHITKIDIPTPKVTDNEDCVSDIVTPSPDLLDLAARINRAYGRSLNHARSAVEDAIEAGICLLEAKDRVAHGQWLPWVETNCDVPIRTAQRFMQIAQGKVEGKYVGTTHLTIEGALDLLAKPKKSNPPGRPPADHEGAHSPKDRATDVGPPSSVSSVVTTSKPINDPKNNRPLSPEQQIVEEHGNIRKSLERLVPLVTSCGGWQAISGRFSDGERRDLLFLWNSLYKSAPAILATLKGVQH